MTLSKGVTAEVRLATLEDVSALSSLIEFSVRTLQKADYSPQQISVALNEVFGVDTQLIKDKTYFKVEKETGELLACGGWSKRRTLFGSDQAAAREPELLDATKDAAKIRAFFVHPAYARQGIGAMLLTYCEEAARLAGFKSFEMGATLTGVPLYRVHGYSEAEAIDVALSNGLSLPIIRMTKTA